MIRAIIAWSTHRKEKWTGNHPVEHPEPENAFMVKRSDAFVSLSYDNHKRSSSGKLLSYLVQIFAKESICV